MIIVEKRVFKMVRKGQAATEFLMTYGWALLVLAIALGSLGYYFISQDSLVPESCAFVDDSLSCLGHKINSSGIYVEIKNFVGQPINITRVDCEIDGVYENNTLNVFLGSGASSADIVCPHSLIPVGRQLIRTNVVIYYIIQGQQFPRTSEGNVIGYVSS
jgi:hypothetical protein